MNTENTFEAANRRYHTAHIAFAQIDAKVIDASATLEELREKHTAAASELNAAREGLVQARSPAKPEPDNRSELEKTVASLERLPEFVGIDLGVPASTDASASASASSSGSLWPERSAVDRETVDAAIEF